MFRTHHCNAIRPEHVGQTVTLCAWVDSPRDHGGVIFIDLRDREGITQVVFRPEESPAAAQAAHALRSEDVVKVTGKVAPRLAGTENANLATGAVEVVASELEVINKSDPLPFQLDAEPPNEDVRLTHRYLDLRRPAMQRNLRLRHKAVQAVRNYMDGQGFLEVETPVLAKSTPEGAREFLVPSRLLPGQFYALSQSPQQYKQLLMVGGVERYFQIAKCFRDEDPRSDRIIELTQVDIEMSFIEAGDIFALTEGLLRSVFQATLGLDLPAPFPRMTWREAMDQYGSDKPDPSLGFRLVDLGEILAGTSFGVFRSVLDAGGVVKAFNAKKFAGITVGQVNELTDIAKKLGAKGLAFIKVEGGAWKSPIVKFFSEEEKAALGRQLEVEEGDLLFFSAGPWINACTILGRIRLRAMEMLGRKAPPGQFTCLWVTEFPLLEHHPEEQKWNAVHHPFTRPLAADLPLLDHPDELGNARAEAYDVVINGSEIGGGSIRIHERDLQQRIFQILGITPERQQTLFPHLLRAFALGAPPHGGIALGVDRLMMLISGTENIRDTVAFPKNNRGQDLMVGSPSEAEPRQLRDLSLTVARR